jgi:hypothetical protein
MSSYSQTTLGCQKIHLSPYFSLVLYQLHAENIQLNLKLRDIFHQTQLQVPFGTDGTPTGPVAIRRIKQFRQKRTKIHVPPGKIQYAGMWIWSDY